MNQLYLLILIISTTLVFTLNAQDPSAIADFESNDKGLLIPRMTLDQRQMIFQPAKGLLVFQTDSIQGFYYNNGTDTDPFWIRLAASNMLTDGDGDTRVVVEEFDDEDSVKIYIEGKESFRFIKNQAGYVRMEEVANENSLYIGSEAGAVNEGDVNTFVGAAAGRNNTTGSANSFFGRASGANNTTGIRNSFFGRSAGFENTTGNGNTFGGYVAGYYNKAGNYNTFYGFRSGVNNDTASYNSFYGFYSGYSNTTGIVNCFFGTSAGRFNTTGDYNTFIGGDAGYNNTTGPRNTYVGAFAGYFNKAGGSNTYIGFFAGHEDSTGFNNVMVGTGAGHFNKTGAGNVFVGEEAGRNNTTAWRNTFIGNDAGRSNTTGEYGSFVGEDAGLNNTTGGSNTFIGQNAGKDNSFGSANIYVGRFAGSVNNNDSSILIGYNAQSSSSYVNGIAIGLESVVNAHDKVVIGNASMVSTGGYTNWSNYSDARYKTNVKEDIPGLKFISLLKPVSYNIDVDGLTRHLRSSISSDSSWIKGTEPYINEEKATIKYSGFLAQDVKSAAEAIGYDFSGIDDSSGEHGLMALRYAEFVVPLVKAVQEQQAIIDSQNAENKQLRSELEALKKRIASIEASLNN